jgi:hypothetical protein
MRVRRKLQASRDIWRAIHREAGWARRRDRWERKANCGAYFRPGVIPIRATTRRGTIPLGTDLRAIGHCDCRESWVQRFPTRSLGNRMGPRFAARHIWKEEACGPVPRSLEARCVDRFQGRRYHGVYRRAGPNVRPARGLRCGHYRNFARVRLGRCHARNFGDPGRCHHAKDSFAWDYSGAKNFAELKRWIRAGARLQDRRVRKTDRRVTEAVVPSRAQENLQERCCSLRQIDAR